MSTSRLPIPGQDDGTWGSILNDYLSQTLTSTGLLNSAVVDTAQLRDGSVTAPKLSPTSPVTGQVLSYNGSALAWSTPSSTGAIPDADTATKGLVKLAGDLGGTANSPTVPGLLSKEPTVAAGTTSQYYRGDKSFQLLDKTAVGLTNVDNTNDVSKPISTATQTALSAKATDNTVVHLAGTETITGSKNFTGGATINSTNIVVVTDSRLTDQRTPLDGSVTNAKLDSATQTALNKSGSAVQQGSLVINVKDYSALGDGSTDDTTAILAAITACPGGGIVYFPQGNYRTSAPIIIPPNVTLQGSHANHLDDTGYVQSNTYIMPLSSFAGTAVLRIVDKQIGSYAADSCGQRIFNIMIEGGALPNTGAGTIDALRAEGKVHGVIIRDFCARNMPGHGINAIPFTRSDSTVVNPYSWRIQRAMADNCRYGFVFNTHTDSTFTDLEAIGNSRSGFYLFTMGNSQFINCRAEWSAWHGYEIHASGSYNHVMFTSCSTDRNGYDGIHVSDSGGNQVIIFNGMNLHRDGRNNGAGGGGYSGFNATGVTSPLILTAVVVSTGVDDDGTQANSPQYGITFASCTYASVQGSFFHGAITGWHDGGSNVTLRRGPNVGEQTGAWNAPVMVLKNDWGTDNASTFNSNLNVADANALVITNTASNAAAPLISINTATSTDRLFSSKSTGDTTTRYNLTSGGLQEWGSGSATRDTNLYRAAAGVIKTDNSLQVTNGIGVNQSPPTSGIGESLTVADTIGLLIQNSAGNSSNPLIKLQTGGGGTDYLLKALVTADTATRYTINVSGQQVWGSGSSAGDTNLYRAAAGVLQSDTVISAKGHATTGFTGATAASRYVGATPSGAPATGTFLVGDFIVDQTGKFYICTTAGTPGTWTLASGSNGLPVGLAGATAATRYVGGVTGAAPSTGTFALGDFAIDQTNGAVYICTTAGSPGTWQTVGRLTNSTIPSATTTTTGTVGTAVTAARADHTHQIGSHASTHLSGGSDSLNLDAQLLTAGEETAHRLMTSSASVITSGTVHLTYFTARKTETITKLMASVDATAAAGLTYGALGIYSIDGSGNGTLVAASTSDTAGFAPAFSLYQPSLTASMTKTAGQLYAVAILCTGSTMPSLTARPGNAQLFSSQSPRLTGSLTGQASLPGTFTSASVVNSGNFFFGAAKP